jgi:L,D-transpeptidase YcbB
MKRYLLFILSTAALVSIFSCNGNSEELTEDEIEISEKLKSRFQSSDLLVFDQDTLLASDEVLSYYKTHDFHPIWVNQSSLNDKGTELFNLVSHSREHGLHPEMFHFKSLENSINSEILDAEVLLTNAFFLFTTHVEVGCIDTSSLEYVWKKDAISFSLTEELEKVKNGTAVSEIISSLEPDFWEYKQLQKGLVDFLGEYPLDTNHYDIPAFKEDSIKCYIAAREALIGHSFIDSTISREDSAFIDQLKIFQKVNGLADDAVVGKWTGRALNKSNLDRFYQAALSLEKWRWRDKLPAKYIRVNVPEFTLYFVSDDAVKSKHRVVVGSQVTPTPEFHASMKTMVTNPFWHVPYSIASTEILVGAKKDSAYFSKRGYKVFQDGSQIDPSSVNWSDVSQGNFGYRVRQNGGGGNSLGRIKFLFPNSDFVFIHDTPSKRLFQNDVRAYSHGCVRLNRPFDLAKAILIEENHNLEGDTLDSYVRRGIQRVIELKDTFEVFIEYYTATGDSSGNVIFHPDIYGRDAKYIENTIKRFDRIEQKKRNHTAKSEEDPEIIGKT